ncbi:non-repetitive nucleoporin [Tothia fuscella]|uniref:Non-repetitive nucleoporin n=1 Tax=Tothia fuscella TaxID=1048955 RepID=A0A9P4NUT0_9PEZI|nr:non-repetitive nucleoporin [Tothia fuscella]
MAFNSLQTPQRPIPGGFVNTPAPRPPNFRMASGGLVGGGGQQGGAVQQPTQNGVAATSGLTAVERAARAINHRLNLETRYPPLEEYVTQGISADYDIPAPPTAQSQIPSAWAPFQKIKTNEIPERVFEQYNTAEVNTSMGLFAELHHAWIAIDSALYLWDYTHPNPDQTELVGYEELTECITAVKLVKPRPGVFVKDVTHLLVVTTSDHLHLIGLASTKSEAGVISVTLYQTGMNVSMKAINSNCVAGSEKTGRVFVGSGTTNDVYEITYQQEEKWFSSKCGKICHTDTSLTSSFSKSFSSQLQLPAVFGSTSPRSEYVKQIVIDDSRDLLYTLSSRSTIRIFHLKPGQSLPLLITRTAREILTGIGHMMTRPQTPLLDPAQGMRFVSIAPITSAESSRLNLVTTTSTGVRIFLSTTSNAYYGSDSSSTPTSMQPYHVKFPPPTSDAEQTTKPAPSSNQLTSYPAPQPIDTSSTSLQTTRISRRYAPGYFFCFVHTQDKDGRILGPDTLFLSAPDTGRIVQPPEPGQVRVYHESGQWMALTGRTEDIGLVSAPFSAAKTPAGFGNELAVQFDQTASEVAILTNTGIHTIRRRRLVDIFAAAIRGSSNDSFEETVKKFIRLYGRSEMCAAAIAVVCNQATDVTADARLANITDRDVIELARRAFIEQGGKATLNEYNDPGPGGSMVDNVQPSPRYHGLMLYVSRLVRSLWKEPLMKEESTPTGGLKITPTITMEKLRAVQGNLGDLQKFLNEKSKYIEGLTGATALTGASSRQEEVTLQGEHRAMTSLVKAVASFIEGIAFVLVLFDDPVDEVVLTLSDESRQRIRQLTYEGLFCTTGGRDLAKELVKAMVNRSIARGANVDTVAEALRRKCGSFCSAEDVVVFKAQEHLRRASEAGADSAAGRGLLNESLKLFQKVAGTLSAEHLSRAVDQYIETSFYAGAIRLALSVAAERDRVNKALAWIRDGRPDQDSRKEAYEKRTSCYALITKVIAAVDQISENSPSSDDVKTSNIARRKVEAYYEINQSDDEVFQTYLFDWYLNKGWSDRLLEIESPYVITYLQRKSNDDTAHANLLWRYYARYNNFFEAAKVQLQLAKSGFDIDLSTRIEHLSRAKANASTRTNGIHNFSKSQQTKQEVVREINDLLDLANIQEDLLRRLMTSDPRVTEDRRPLIESELNGRILPLDTLYNDYADQAGYWDICLIIYELADYRSSTNIATAWHNFIDSANDDAMVSGQAAAFEVVAEKVQTLGKRLNCSDSTFPIPVILPKLVNYAIQDNISNKRSTLETWPIELFLDLGIPHEVLVTGIEDLFYNPERPWTTDRYRIKTAQLLTYTVDAWYMATSRGGGVAFGSEENAAAMLELMRVITGWGQLPREAQDEAVRVREAVDRIMW